MTMFRWTPNGYMNLARIDHVPIAKDGTQSLIVDGQTVDSGIKDFGNELVSIIPVQGPVTT
jgi:hypothetical protein